MLIYEWDFDKNEVVQWERRGECNQCGDCCRVCVKYNKPSEDINVQEATANGNYHGICNQVQVDGKDNYFWDVRIDNNDKDFQPCEDLKGNSCFSHNGTREVLCRYFPMSPRNAELFEQCSYRFEKIESWEID